VADLKGEGRRWGGRSLSIFLRIFFSASRLFQYKTHTSQYFQGITRIHALVILLLPREMLNVITGTHAVCMKVKLHQSLYTEIVAQSH